MDKVIMTAEEWCKHYNKERNLEWLEGTTTRARGSKAFPIEPIVGTMLKVHSEDCALLQPWNMSDGTSWVMLSVHNLEHDLDLPSKQGLMVSARNYYKYNLHSWPRSIRDDLIRLFPESDVCDSHAAFLVTSSDGTKCSRTRLSRHEFLTLRENCPSEFLEYQGKYYRQADKYASLVLKETPHIEKPCIMYIAGCDDSSYTLLAERPETLTDLYESFLTTPLSYREIIDKYHFAFTN